MTDKAEMLESYDWKEAFAFAGGPGENHGSPSSCGEPPADETPFSLEDVAEVIAANDGEGDEMDWVCVVRLKDGRFASVEAGCDYTGWD